MRRLIYSLLAADTGLMALLPGGLRGDRMEGVPDLLPFAVLTHEGPSRGMGRHLSQRTSLWVHDQSQDYTVIDSVLRYAVTLVESLAPVQVNGIWLSSAVWQGTSADLYDPERGTNTKNAAFLLTGSGL